MSIGKEIIRIENLRREFMVGGEKVKALRGISFTINEGEFVTIMGTSGSGKSTLLNLLGCLDTPTSGEYLLDEISVRSMSKNQRAVTRNRKIGFVFQNYNLLPKTTAIENVELPLLYNTSVSAKERREKAIASLKSVGLGERLNHKSNQMSGGQQQRVAIARALVNDPVIILADEATGNLDTRTSFSILMLFQELHAKGRTIIFVTHNPELADYSSRNIVLRDGKIVSDTVNMNIANLLKIALKALNNNKLRCFLTMLGIIIGVASVITMLAIGQGSKNSIKEQISEMGSNMIMIHPGNMHRGGVRQSADDMQTLDESDYEALKDLPGIAAVSPSVNSGGQLVNGNNNYPSSIYGVTPEYLDIRRFKVKEGSIFTEHDIKSAAKVCILGKTVVDNLFPNGEDPVGRVIRFGKIPLTVIGVLESKGTNSMGQDQDDVVIAPYTTVMKRILAIDYIQGIFASAVDENRTDETIDAITEVLRTRHKIKEDADDDFEIRSQQELSEMMNSTSDMMTVLLACIAGISLLVGGIGIMNIMYVSVTERTREIGLRMSIGARGIDILSQFLIEAVIISVSGGVIGIMLGIIASWLVNAIAHWPVYIQAYSVVLSFAVCTVTGVFFGWYPAKKAAGLDPIEAIRYE